MPTIDLVGFFVWFCQKLTTIRTSQFSLFSTAQNHFRVKVRQCYPHLVHAPRRLSIAIRGFECPTRLPRRQYLKGAPSMKLRHYCALLPICYLLTAPSGAMESWAQQQSKNSHLTFCELVENPAKYDGQRITVDAYYSYFFEMSWLFCWECKDKGRTWLEIPIDDDAAGRRLHRELAKLPKGHGVINGQFTGIFHAGGGPYGHMGAYRNKFDLQELSHTKVVIRDTKTAVSEENCSCREPQNH